MPASVLLALLVTTSLLALTPALVRRYDPDERMIADRAASDARVLAREAHRPGRPLAHAPPPAITAEPHDPGAASSGALADAANPLVDTSETTGFARPTMPLQRPPVYARPARGWERRGSRAGDSVRLELDESVTGEDPVMRETARLREERAEWWRRRHRRILYVLLALTLVELLGVLVAGPGFWIGATIALGLVIAYVWFLRSRAKRIQRSKASHPARAPKAAITAGPDEQYAVPTYVPEQPTDGDDHVEPVEDGPDDHRESFLFENGTLRGDEPEPPHRPERPESRRGDGSGVRGRSYESPAKLERLCLTTTCSTATS